jgi:hypothetical protein
MNSFNQTLLAMLLGVAVLSACSKKQEEPVVSVDAPKAPVAAEVKIEPVKEEPGGWVPPPAESEAAAIAEPPAPATPPVSAPTEKEK